MKLKNRFIQLVILLLSLHFVSCENEANKEPDYLIEKEKFIEILKDYALVESTLNLNVNSYSGASFDSAYNFNVLAENKITKAQYDTTLKYYASKPEEFKKIMETVLERLNIEKAK